MAKVNPALFDPLSRIESAARRAADLLTTTRDAPRDSALIRQELKEMADALDAFERAVDNGERPGFSDGSMRAHGGT
jgi:hypothetical protein